MSLSCYFIFFTIASTIWCAIFRLDASGTWSTELSGPTIRTSFVSDSKATPFFCSSFAIIRLQIPASIFVLARFSNSFLLMPDSTLNPTIKRLLYFLRASSMIFFVGTKSNERLLFPDAILLSSFLDGT